MWFMRIATWFPKWGWFFDFSIITSTTSFILYQFDIFRATISYNTEKKQKKVIHLIWIANVTSAFFETTLSHKSHWITFDFWISQLSLWCLFNFQPGYLVLSLYLGMFIYYVFFISIICFPSHLFDFSNTLPTLLNGPLSVTSFSKSKPSE
jgi:hypothetical protein